MTSSISVLPSTRQMTLLVSSSRVLVLLSSPSSHRHERVSRTLVVCVLSCSKLQTSHSSNYLAHFLPKVWATDRVPYLASLNKTWLQYRRERFSRSGTDPEHFETGYDKRKPLFFSASYARLFWVLSRVNESYHAHHLSTLVFPDSLLITTASQLYQTNLGCWWVL